MNVNRVVVAGLLLASLVGGVGVVGAEQAEENPACSNPNQGLVNSVESSDGTSIVNAGPGLVIARTNIGCEAVAPQP